MTPTKTTPHAQARDQRKLLDLESVGPAAVRDLQLLGVSTVAELARCEPDVLYAKLCTLTGQRQDPCVGDVFAAAVAQAKDPDLPREQRRWWYWSRVRKAGAARRGSPR